MSLIELHWIPSDSIEAADKDRDFDPLKERPLLV